jgi:ABC-type sugar transport system substrate-binding protein
MLEKRKKRIAMVLTLAVVLAALMLGSAGTAFAQMIGGAIQCDSVPCVATGAHQVLFERVGDGVRDKMIAQGGHDHLDARAYTNDRDVAKGSGGHDLLRVNDGDAMDGAIGGPGWDTCVVDAAIEAADTCETVVYR